MEPKFDVSEIRKLKFEEGAVRSHHIEMDPCIVDPIADIKARIRAVLPE